ncbi:hypothetical protein CERSUDRAFT_110231 [Gelatoporia subvermispora B]|uniref:Uncharacterized protein n=1 Tax=Ceriporiopsis subvermispora (strain B) TaxID=914234 RepID=M2QWZ3_CERS8|nr:hypothetical protein CERSUDRAFT_110231 [Gelatoporia subvermispora B]
MHVPNLSGLTIHDPGPDIPDDIRNASDHYMVKLRNYARLLPYSIELNSQMQQMLDGIILRITQTVEAKDFEPGLVQWDSMLSYWTMLKYPIPKEKRIKLAKLYYHICTTPGMPGNIVASCADTLQMLVRSKKKLTLEDMRLPWKPVYDILSKVMFLTRRQFELSQTPFYMGYIAQTVRRFFHPAAIDEMLSTFVPMLNGSNLSHTLASQYYMLTFLPMTHPQSYLPMLFRVWESINSYMFDDRMLHFLAQLVEMHVDPAVSDPKRLEEIPDDERSENEGRRNFSKEDLETKWRWGGLFQDVGIFKEHEWDFLMCKCMASMEIPLADAGSLTTGPNADNQASFELNRLPKPNWRIASLARIIVYSMAPDGLPTPGSTAPTPQFTPQHSGASTPLPQHTSSGLGDYLSAPIRKGANMKIKTYLAGSKALDALAKFVASTEGFFHPTNSGSWTTDLSAFIKWIVYDFNKRWHEEQQPDCKTPMHRRLTRDMKRELVKSLRTVVLLAMFSQDAKTVSNIQSCLKSMSVMEPDLILHPILERAEPALETLTETQRTIAVIKALGAVAPAIVCRHVYYPGAKHLLPILELLLPGIDLNDPPKTFCTTSFVIEIAQHIKFGELVRQSGEQSLAVDIDVAPPSSSRVPQLEFDKFPDGIDGMADGVDGDYDAGIEDGDIVDSTGSFADWVASFLRRVILLFENLPEEGANGSAGGPTEVQLIDSVCSAFSQICVHLSEPLYDMVLNMVYDYATANVRSNAVRAIHSLVECVTNANPAKTLAKFVPFCERNIHTELEHGASSLRTTSSGSVPLPSDATLHWNLAILRGCMYNDGRAVLPYRDRLVSLFKLLHRKTFSKRGFSSSGELISSTLLTLTHTYPLENKFVNPDEWASEEFQRNHHKYWGKLYKPEEVKLSWHVPNDDEIDFALEIFREAIEPTLNQLDGLIGPGVVRDAIWRNDFCRHLSWVRNAFSGIPTLAKEFISTEDMDAAMKSTDLLHEIPEMIATVQPLNAGFALSDKNDPRHQYITSLRRRFGQFLHKASRALLQQGEENTVDAVQMLIRSVETYLLNYGDSRDSYIVQSDRYNSEITMAMHYAGQKVWPRAVYVRRARFYHSARLRWNSIERRRGELEDSLVDDITGWAMWHYATVREASQSLLENLCNSYDGVRRRCLPSLLKALEPGTDDDRMKGALWTLNRSIFAKYAVDEPVFSTEFVKKLFACQHNEKPSIQECVASLLDTYVNALVEPSFIFCEIINPGTVRSLDTLKHDLTITPESDELVSKCIGERVERVDLINKTLSQITTTILEIAKSSNTHWRYSIVATRCLRTLIRRDVPMISSHVRYLLEATYDANSSMRYYAQRAIMKISRYVKLRTMAKGPNDIAMERNHNPLRRTVPIPEPSHEFTSKWLAEFRQPLHYDEARRIPILRDKIQSGWLVWGETIDCYLAPDATQSVIQTWETDCQEAVQTIREVANDPQFWQKLSIHFSAENHNEVISQDNVSCVKSIFQLLEDEPWEALMPTVEELINDKDKNKQRGAAEFVAGVLGASKHWLTDRQAQFWEWFIPHMKTIFARKSNDTLPIWMSFLEYTFFHRDPRRLQPLVDYLMVEFQSVDFNSESSFDVTQVLSFFRTFYEELNWKFTPWVDDAVQRCWQELQCEHDDVLTHIAEFLAFTSKIKRRPMPSIPTTEVFVRECRTASPNQDILGIRGVYHKDRVLELTQKFEVWRNERLPGARAIQSTYDRVGILVCKWLFQMVHDTNAPAAYDYILPLLPELFRFTELNDNDDLSYRANLLLVRMCGVITPRHAVSPLLDEIFKAIQKSPSWRVRLKILPLVQVFYFRQSYMISDGKVVEMMETVCRCLDDDVVEVREMAAITLSGILRVSPRKSVVALKNRFVRLLEHANLPDKKSPVYNSALRQRHAAILGICALIDSYPYTVEKWMPQLLTSVLAEHTYDPIPISTTVRKCASQFKKTHQDTWHEDSKRFSEEQLAALSTLLTGSSYYA